MSRNKKVNAVQTAKDLDKYYTKDDIALLCLGLFLPLIDQNAMLVEPSAGNGSFLRAAQEAGRKIAGFDILPEGAGIVELDFLNQDIREHLDIKDVAFLGNPPFGKKGATAIAFINKCLDLSGTVGFILPIQFRKWSAQSKIQKGASLIMDADLPDDSFTIEGKPYSIRSSFQVWSRNHPLCKDLRLDRAPPTSHPDFEMWQYNRTKQAERFFDYNWDFAVPRQGFYDYSVKVYKKEDCDRKKQWIFFKANTPEALERLNQIDFAELSKLNSGIPGFGKADVIKEYTRER